MDPNLLRQLLQDQSDLKNQFSQFLNNFNAQMQTITDRMNNLAIPPTSTAPSLGNIYTSSSGTASLITTAAAIPLPMTPASTTTALLLYSSAPSASTSSLATIVGTTMPQSTFMPASTTPTYASVVGAAASSSAMISTMVSTNNNYSSLTSSAIPMIHTSSAPNIFSIAGTPQVSTLSSISAMHGIPTMSSYQLPLMNTSYSTPPLSNYQIPSVNTYQPVNATYSVPPTNVYQKPYTQPSAYHVPNSTFQVPNSTFYVPNNTWQMPTNQTYRRKALAPLPYDLDAESDFSMFIQNFEQFCSLEYGQDTYEQWGKVFGDYLKGEIKDIFDVIGGGNIPYSHLKVKITTHVHDYSTRKQSRLISQYNNLKLKSGESLYVFALRLERLYDTLYPSRNKDEELPTKFLTSIPTDVAREIESGLNFLKLLPFTAVTWQLVVDFLKSKSSSVLPTNTSDMHTFNNYTSRNETHNWYPSNQVTTHFKAGVNKPVYNNKPSFEGNKPANNNRSSFDNFKYSKPTICSFCRKQGHYSNVCRSRLHQCLVCGDSSHKTLQCPDYRPRNLKNGYHSTESSPKANNSKIHSNSANSPASLSNASSPPVQTTSTGSVITKPNITAPKISINKTLN